MEPRQIIIWSRSRWCMFFLRCAWNRNAKEAGDPPAEKGLGWMYVYIRRRQQYGERNLFAVMAGRAISSLLSRSFASSSSSSSSLLSIGSESFLIHALIIFNEVGFGFFYIKKAQTNGEGSDCCMCVMFSSPLCLVGQSCFLVSLQSGRAPIWIQFLWLRFFDSQRLCSSISRIISLCSFSWSCFLRGKGWLTVLLCSCCLCWAKWNTYIFCYSGRNLSRRSGIFKYSTAAAVEAPIHPSVDANYTQLLINGQFVDAASGKHPVIHNRSSF